MFHAPSTRHWVLALCSVAAGCGNAEISEDGAAPGGESSGVGASSGKSTAGGGGSGGGSGSGVDGERQHVCGVSGACVRDGDRDVYAHPFSQCSPFNHPIGSEAVYVEPQPRLIKDEYEKYGDWVEDWSTFGCIQASDNAFYRAGASPSHAGKVENDAGTRTFPLLLPDGIAPPDDVDKHLFVLDPDEDLVVETFHSRVEAGNVFAPWVLAGSLRDSAIISEPAQDANCERRGTRAYGGSAIAGLIRRGELKNGIFHALALKVPTDALNTSVDNGGWVWPASCAESKGKATSGNVFMGTLFAIPPDEDLSGITDPLLHNLAVAYRDYGGYVVDGGGPIKEFPGCINALAEFDDPDALSVNRKWRQLGLIASKLRVVINQEPDAVGGGGTPLTCFSPNLPD